MIEFENQAGQAYGGGATVEVARPLAGNERGAVVHEVKSWPEFFEANLAGRKTFDLRRATDRDYRVGDFLRMREFDPGKGYTGRVLDVEITYVTSADHPCALSEKGLDDGFCILAFRPINLPSPRN